MRVRCEECQKATYKGCGKHVEQVLRGVDASDRCRCAELVVSLISAALAQPTSITASTLSL
jgi:hypothetical protein